MKKHALLLYLIIIGFFQNPSNIQAAPHSSTIKLSKEATISILTCAPGDELYASFGHTGIRVKDKINHLDIVFNYGTFDFNTPGFYLKFARGLLPYQLTISRFDSFIIPYMREARSVYAQTLQLDSLQKQLLMDLLMENYRPENRSYLYNFLYDNCTTRARDIIQKSTNKKITWPTPSTTKSFWNLLDEYLERSPWIQWGIHTILGSPANASTTDWERMFLPDYLLYGLDSATYNNSRLASPIETIYQAPVRHKETPWYLSPLFVFAAGTLLLVISLQYFRQKSLLRFIATFFFLITGLIGCLILFLGFFTKHPTMFPNFNILWANPLNLFAFFFFGQKPLPRLIRNYLSIYLVILILGFSAWLFLRPAVLPSSMFLFLVMAYLTYRLKQQK